jgi:hypothetical protein
LLPSRWFGRPLAESAGALATAASAKAGLTSRGERAPARALAPDVPGKEGDVKRIVVAVIVVACVGVGIRAQRRAAPGVPEDGAVRTLSREAGRSEAGKKSDTDYWLDSRIVRLTARYADAVVTTERDGGGVVTSRVADTNGNVTATLTVRSTVLQYAPSAGDPLVAANDSGERPTLEAASRQAFGLFKDGTGGLTWQRGLMRPHGATRDLDPLELHTEWADGLTAHATRTFNASVRVNVKGRDAVYAGEVVSTKLTRDGAHLGASIWFPAQQTFMFNVGRAKGSLDPDVLSEKNNGPGGWMFTVTPGWVNLQTIAFHYFSAPVQAVAARGNLCEPTTGLLAKTVEFFVPVLHANDAGCDYPFVWLNGTGYEPCCNRHDRCYSRFGCTYRTWWMVWTSWRCNVCNLLVYNCFMYGGDTWKGYV